ncbi:unnamed protein product [Lymnaea stagnalis]|uniref:Uncharacterized protein n=1 Tax=Lymnaea stagnalis TaxID=6523 RepID=A0AAV2IHK3_LYMST
MGFQEGFKKSDVVTKVCFYFVLAASFCNWIAFCTTSWIIRPDSHVGLWRSCGGYGSIEGCRPLDGAPSHVFAGTQALGIIGFMGMNIGFLLLLLFMFSSKYSGSSETKKLAGFCLILSALSWTLTIVVFICYFKVEYSHVSLGFSFGLAFCALILGFCAGIMVLFAGRGGAVNPT